jgi:hypothetical protein
MQDSYESFYDIKPVVVNESDKPIYYFPSWYGLDFIYFDEGKDEGKNEWEQHYKFVCLTGRKKILPDKLNTQIQFMFSMNKSDWDNLICCDVVFDDYKVKNPNSRIRYKLQLRYGGKKSKVDLFSYSPEFEVIEKDFKK